MRVFTKDEHLAAEFGGISHAIDGGVHGLGRGRFVLGRQASSRQLLIVGYCHDVAEERRPR